MSFESPPAVTVAMIVHNGESFIKETIDSILKQSFQDFEFVIINDASTDQTVEIIQSYENPKIRLFSNETNMGIVYSRNRFLAEARGKYIAVTDADDISSVERLALQVSFLDSRSEVNLVGGWGQSIDSQGRLLHEWRLPNDSDHLAFTLCLQNPFIHSTAMFRRAEALKVDGYGTENRLAQDYLLWTRLALLGPVCNLPMVLAYYRIHDKNVTLDGRDSATESAARIAHAYAEDLTGLPQSEDVMQYIFKWGNAKVSPAFLMKAIRHVFQLYKTYHSQHTLSPKTRRAIRSEVIVRVLVMTGVWLSQWIVPQAFRKLGRSTRISIRLALAHLFAGRQ